MFRRLSVLLGLGLLFALPLIAQEVPPPLQDWQGWVLHDRPEHVCPVLSNAGPGRDSYQCEWPGKLAVDARADGGSFTLGVRVDAPSWVALPGGLKNWPQQVSVNNQLVTVLQHAGEPMLWLSPGNYQVHGVLPWVSRPARVHVPAAIGVVALSVNGVAVERVERNDDALTLGEAAAAQRAADALSLRVYRQLTDGLPATLETRLQFTVTGSAREQLLGPVLPAGFVATSETGDLAARLERDGHLRVQLRPGQWTLTLDARASTALGKVALQLPAAPWPRQEIWSYADDTDLRSTRVEGTAVDPAQAGVPNAWRKLPAFALDGQTGLTIASGNRGDAGGHGDRLTLQRDMWLDFSGRGVSVADHLTGELRHPQRLDVVAPWQLQRASQDSEPLLVSTDAKGRSGIEVRQRALDLVAGLRLPAHGGAIPTAGWRVPLESIQANLYLPSGYRLLGTVGTDQSPDSWLAQWTLLDLFVVALLVLLAGRLLGWRWGLVVAVLLALAQHESGAPRWTLALALALMLLLRALPGGRLREGARIGAIAMLALAVLWALPFVATQLQYALHPQLANRAPITAFQAPPPAVEEVSVKAAPSESDALASRSAGPTMRQMPPPPPPPAPPVGQALSQAVDVTGTRVPATALVPIAGQQGPLQAGVGVPEWDVGNNYQLGWSGPVASGQSMRLVIVPAWLVRLLRVMLVGLLIGLLARLAQHLLSPLPLAWRGGRSSAAAAALLLVCILLPGTGRAQDLPSQPLLEQLQSRLTEAPKCTPHCAELAQASLQVSAEVLEMQLQAHVQSPTALQLPQTESVLQLLGVSVDGRSEVALARRDGQLLLRLERGVHQVVLRYRMGTIDSTTIQFALRPHLMQFSGQGWSLDGVEDGRPLGQSITLNRTRQLVGGDQAASVQSFPAYVRLTRHLIFGVEWTVQNEVQRMAPLTGGFSISLPLLPGEHPLDADTPVRDGHIRVTFNANSDSASWTSRLDQSAQLALQAPALGERAEVWRIDSAPMWHVDAHGVPTSASASGLRYQPLPGETLHLALTKPTAAPGTTLAFDHVRVSLEVGARVTATTLDLRARSTRGGEHALALPPDAELLGASRDGDELNLTVRDGKISLPLLPGEHRYALRWREPHGVASLTRTSTVALGAPVANIDTTVQLPHDRWVLWTWGPMVGPAVLYWSQLLVLLLAAWVLARLAPTPLRFRHWLLLGLGFSAFAWSAYALVVLWLIALGLRRRHIPPTAWSAERFNLLQAGLLALSILALLTLIGAVPRGLLGLPEMHVTGNGSSAFDLRWFADQSTGMLPRVGVLSVSLWFYKLAMLAWALWLANALIGWLRWAFDAWSAGGYWRPRELKGATPPQFPPEVPPGARESPRDA
ncbi:MAG: hypothetical protein ABIU96_04985 [Rhodanobacter sp.]